MIKDSNPQMNNRHLDRLIRELSNRVEGELGFWRFELAGRELMTITDESHNRMRVMTPIAETDRLDKEILEILLAANFDRALNAKYAISEAVLWSVFTHPLGELTPHQFRDAVQQVKTLADNFGTTFSSSDLVFGG